MPHVSMLFPGEVWWQTANMGMWRREMNPKNGKGKRGDGKWNREKGHKKGMSTRLYHVIPSPFVQNLLITLWLYYADCHHNFILVARKSVVIISADVLFLYSLLAGVSAVAWVNNYDSFLMSLLSVSFPVTSFPFAILGVHLPSPYSHICCLSSHFPREQHRNVLY